MLGSKIYIYLHISIPGDLYHSFLLWSEQKDALENYCIYIFYTVLLLTFLEGQIYQMNCNAVFSNQKYSSMWCTCPSKYVKKTMHISSFLWKVARTYSTCLESSQTFKIKLFSKMS